MLRLDGVRTAYGSSRVLFGVDLEVGAGEVVTLMGRNGMGKTTTVRSILGLTPPSSGRVVVDGTDVTGWPAHRIARLGIGLVPEGREVFPALSVRENLVATSANRARHDRPWTLDGVFELFPRLAERRAQYGSSLSGGEQQMLAIARALMINPRLLILDEATEGLAPLVRAEIWDVIARLKAQGQSILLIDKNLAAVKRIADRHVIMEKGRVVWSGETADLDVRPDIVHRYLGV